MELNNGIKFTMEGFIKWAKSLNDGHKRLWLIISIVWFFSFIVFNIYEYYTNVKYCNSAEKDYTSLAIYGVSNKSYKKCEVKMTKVEALGNANRSKKKIYNSYQMSAKHSFTPILWSVTLPIGLPIIFFIMAWVRSGYNKR